MSRLVFGAVTTSLVLVSSLVTTASMGEKSTPDHGQKAVNKAVFGPHYEAASTSESTKAAASSRSYLGVVELFDNGDTNYDCCSEVTAYTLAEDFQLDTAASVSAASIILEAPPGDFPSNWDGTLDWWIYADAAGEPGTAIASGAAENVVWGLEEAGDFYLVIFDLGTDVPLDKDTRYWLGIHMAADWSTEIGFYWSLTDPGDYSTAYSSTGAGGPWSDTAHHLSFTLRGPAQPADPSCFEVLTSWTYGISSMVAVSGDYAYFQNGTYLQVADISTITNPQVVAEIDLRSESWGGAISGDHLLLPTNDNELLIVDISTPAAPAVVSAITVVGSQLEVLVDGNLAYLSGLLGVSIFDITTITAPVQIGLYPIAGGSWAASIEGATAFIAAFEDGLHVVDVSDPTAPTMLGHLPINGYQEYVTSVPGYVFLADGFDNDLGSGQFRVIDVSTPSAPFETASLGGYGWLEAITMWGNYAIVPGGDDGLHIIDVSTPSAPVDVGEIALSGYQVYAATTGTHAITCDWNGPLHIIDLNPVTSPSKVAEIDLPGISSGVAFLDADTLITAGWGRLNVMDISTPAAPSLTASIDVGANYVAYDMEVVGDLAIVSFGWDRVTVVDLSNPASPSEMGSVPVGGIQRIDVSGNYVYVAANNRLEVVDITTPSAPTIHGTGYDMKARDIGITGDTAFVASRTDGLQCMDVSSPDAPVLIGGMVNDLDAFAVGTWGDQAAVGGRTMSLGEGAYFIADVASPAAPSALATRITPRWSRSMVYSDGLTFAGGVGWFGVLDVTNPRMPIQVASSTEIAPGHYEPDTLSGLIAFPNGWSGGRTGFHLLDYGTCINTVIFADGFETGDLTFWSSSTP